MAVTAANHRFHNTGNQRVVEGTLAFDTLYAKGGEALTPKTLGLGILDRVDIQPQSGFNFEYDLVNQLLHVKRSGSMVQIEDTGVFTAGAAYTMHMRPAYILGIRGTAGSTGSKRLIPTGETLGAGQCSINFATGVITWGDATVTRATIMYIPLGVPGFTSDLLVVDEALALVDATGGEGRATLAARAACINYVWNDEDNEVLTIVPTGEVPGANECDIDILNTADTTIDVLTSDIGNGAGKLKVCYIKYVEALHGRMMRFVDQTDVAALTNVVNMHSGSSSVATSLHIGGLVLPGFGQCWAGEDTTTNKFGTFLDADGTAAAGLCVWNPWTNTFTFHSDDSLDTLSIPWLQVPAGLMGSVLLDIPPNEDLSSLSAVKFVAYGS